MEKVAAIAHSALKNVYTTWFLLGIPAHARLRSPVTGLRTIADSCSPDDDEKIRASWVALTALLLGDWKHIRRVCGLLLLVNAGVMRTSYLAGDTLTTNLAAVSACFPATTLAHVCFMEWHFRSLDQQTHPWIYWCKVTKQRAQSALKRTTVLLAAPLAGTIWSVIMCVVLFSSAVLRLPIPMCLVDAGANHSRATSSHFVPICRPQAEPAVVDIHLSTTARVAVLAILLVGAAHVAFNTYHFTMLGVPPKDDEEEAFVVGSRGTSSSVSHASPSLPLPSHQDASRQGTRRFEPRAASPTPWL